MTRGEELLAEMRSARGGGAPSRQQQMAYRNIVVHELGEEKATALVRGIWKTTTDKLQTEQLDALLSWGKKDTFAEEVALVGNALRAERATANAQAGASSEQASTPAAPRTGTRSRTARAETAGGT
jgi:hypothetical protein